MLIAVLEFAVVREPATGLVTALHHVHLLVRVRRLDADGSTLGDPHFVAAGLQESEDGEGLEHLCLEFRDIREAVKRVKAGNVSLYQNKIYLDREDGFEAFIYPEHMHGVTIELIEPYATSRGYRFAK